MQTISSGVRCNIDEFFLLTAVARNERLVIIGAAFAAVGVAALVRSFAATPKKITAKNTPPRTYQTVTKPTTKDAKKLHVNVWTNKNKVVAPAGESGKWDIHMICDINVYQKVGKYGVWTYDRGDQQKGGSDVESCVTSRNGITHWSCLSAVGVARQNGLCKGTDGEGDHFVPVQLAKQGYKNYLRFKGAGVY